MAAEVEVKKERTERKRTSLCIPNINCNWKLILPSIFVAKEVPTAGNQWNDRRKYATSLYHSICTLVCEIYESAQLHKHRNSFLSRTSTAGEILLSFVIKIFHFLFGWERDRRERERERRGKCDKTEKRKLSNFHAINYFWSGFDDNNMNKYLFDDYDMGKYRSAICL